MLRIGGGTHFLVLRRQWDLRGHTVEIVPKFDDTLRDWEPGSRISPILPTIDNDSQESVFPKFESGDKTWLVFLGPVHPGRLRLENGQSVFLTLGLFNVLVCCSSEEQAKEVESLGETLGARWESWELQGHLIKATTFAEISPKFRSLPPEVIAPIPSEPSALKPTAREYSTLFASTVSRATIFCPAAVPDLLSFDRVFREVQRRASDPVRKHGDLVITNAALSRYSSQTYAGTSPILETECHFWTHSLLGVGMMVATRN